MSQTEELSRREEQFLENVLENLRQRIRKIAQELEEGQKDIESMHEYYWENYTEMDQYGKAGFKTPLSEDVRFSVFRESGFYL